MHVNGSGNERNCKKRRNEQKKNAGFYACFEGV